jgi:DNA polymerase III alpha subunit/nucleotidyltransferase/DNA polymerase involved in DNA repair
MECPTRSIVHLDADAFFPSVEQAADARLRGKPIAVGGEKRGIIASASYEARKFGIYTPMPTALARRLCPRLILLPGDFEKYELFSRLMFSYAYDFTPDVEIGSIDEGYFDLTGARKPALNIAETIRQAIRQALKLSVSEGIGSNKLVSQIASKVNKPAAFQFVPPGGEAGFLWPLPNKWLPGVGPKTANQLNAAGLAHISHIAHTPADLLSLLVGRLAPQLRSFAWGIDERPVVPVRAAAKSYSEQETFAADTTDEEFLEATLRRMGDKLMAKVRADGKSIRTLTVKVRYNDMDEDQTSASLDEPTDLETELYGEISKLLRKAWKRRVSLRLVSLKLSNLYDGRFRSMLALDTPARQHEAQQRLADVVDGLREKYGRGVVLRGHDFILRVKRERSEEPGGGTGVSLVRTPGTVVPSVPTLINTPLQRGGTTCVGKLNRFSGFRHTVSPPDIAKTAEAVESSCAAPVTPLKRGVNESGHAGRLLEYKVQSPRLPHRPSNRAHPPSTTCIPLNVHSYYSFLDSTLSISAIVDLAKRHELPAIALTDKHNLHGAVEFAEAAAKAGIKAIIGAELKWNGQRLCLYVENQTGYHNLCRILSEAGGESPKPETRSPKEGRSPKSEIRSSGFRGQDSMFDVRCSSPAKCAPSGFGLRPSLGPRISDFGLSTDGLLAVSPAVELAQFFPGRFYLAVSSLDAFEKRPRPLPCVVSFPIHYERPADRWQYDVVQSIRTLTLLRQQHPGKRLDGEYHFRPVTELQQLFAAQPELLAHSRELADRCSFTFSLGKPQFPGYAPPDGSTPAAFLRRLVMEGLQRRYPKEHARLKPQLEQELLIITEVGYEEYFLVMWDILQECRRRGIEWITRGSAADSLACYCLGISGVCPIRFDLYFRRFLNKDRMALNKLPDIDVDFPHDRKDDVVDLVFDKYGPARTAIVGGFSTFQSRSAFAEVAKVLGVSEFQVRRITERLPHFSRASELAEVVAASQECRDLPLEEEPYRSALQMAHFLDGFPRYPKMHPCGLVVSRQPMNEITPCFISAKGYPTTHFDMDSIEAVGLVKMDILAQGGLAVMRDVKEMLEKENPKSGARSPKEIRSSKPETRSRSADSTALCKDPGAAQVCNLPDVEQSTGTSDFGFRPSFGLRVSDFGSVPSSPFDLDTLEPWDDPRVWEMIASGQARAVHHIESPAMISLCKMCNVRDIDTLIAIVSVIRPGAANENKKQEFARRYQGLSPVRYPHPSLAACLRSTYGLVVYEEHILQICEAFAGLAPGRADILRRALGKEKADVIAQIQTEFAECARRHGRTEAEITEVWNLLAGFQGYAFCKAHSTAYGVEAYQSAWLKLHYPPEFMAAVLTNGKGFYSPLVYVLECHRLCIPLLPPSVNEPGPQFSVTQQGNPKTEDRRPKEGRFPKAEAQSPTPAVPSDFGFRASFGLRVSDFALHLTHTAIRVPVLQVKGLTHRTKEAIRREHARGQFTSLADFFLRVQPLNEEMEALIRVGAFDGFGQSRTTQFWEFKALCHTAEARGAESKGPLANRKSQIANHQLWLLPPGNLDRLPSVPLAEPTRLQRLRNEEELLGYPASGHPLELFLDIAWETYCPVNRLGDHVGAQIVTCGLVIEQRLFHQVTGEPMKFITIADWTGVVETELFARTYQSYAANTVRYRVLEITATVEPFENSRGFTLRVLRANKPRTRK